MPHALFDDRIEAGRALAVALKPIAAPDAIVLGIPRGGVIVAAEVAKALGLELGVIVTRKLGAPGHPEFAIGAIAEGDVRAIDEQSLRSLGVGREQLAAIENAESIELERRASAYRRRTTPALDDRRVIIVDDGVATGATARAACRSARQQGAREILLATPVAPANWQAELHGEADQFFALKTPEPFWAVGSCYRRFAQTTDAEVLDCLEKF